MNQHTSIRPTPVAVLGLGEMGRALAPALIEGGHPTTVWNRSPAKTEPLVARGATAATSPAAAVSASPLTVTCLFDHASVHEVLDPISSSLHGRSLINVTTTTPNEARDLSEWAASNGIDYLDGAIMAVPQWAREVVDCWPDDVTQAPFDTAAADQGVRLAESIPALLRSPRSK
jgi:3-hydroxyisobutyrate dehydrogenase-like beta-hydroxyacid dehydrogenase